MEESVLNSAENPLAGKSLAVCSIVRNAQRGLERNIPVIRALCARFKDYRIIVFENDSTDRTVSILEAWASADPKVTVSCRTLGIRTIPRAAEVTVNPFFSRYRIVKMADFRKQYLEYLERQEWNPDYLVVVDLDVERLELPSILTSFAPAPEWDAVTSFGYSLSPRLRRRYHDAYALVELGKEQVPQTESSIQSVSDRWGTLRPGDDWIPVYSAFGGLAIYRYACVRGLRYRCVDNGDARVEVRCEHFGLCQQMHERGYGRIYVNPGMKLKYQRLTLKIVLGHIDRLLKGWKR